MEDSELDRLHQRLRSSWWLWLSTFTTCLLAEACARAGRPDKGLALLSAVPEHSLEMVYSSEIYRCRGELLLSQGYAHAPEAEHCFRTAVEVASRGARRSLELRAVTSLSRLLQTQGKREEARHMLAEIYARFTEGFDTADLRAARMLLDELSAASS
jgi:adenylate cyclase